MPTLFARWKRLYGLRPTGDGEELFTVDVASGAGKSWAPWAGSIGPRAISTRATRLTFAPDGKSLVYGVGPFHNNLWMLEGFAAKESLLARLGL